MKNEKKDCKDCEFYREMHQLGKFKCSVNNHVYTSNEACFMFRDKKDNKSR